jgi:hypothetical protein
MKSLRFLILYIVLYNSLSQHLIIVVPQDLELQMELIMSICDKYTENSFLYNNFHATDGEEFGKLHFLCLQKIKEVNDEDKTTTGKDIRQCKIQKVEENPNFIFAYIEEGKLFHGMHFLQYDFVPKKYEGLSLICVPNVKNVDEESALVERYDKEARTTIKAFSTVLQTVVFNAEKVIGEGYEKEDSTLKQLKNKLLLLKKLNPSKLIEKVGEKISKAKNGKGEKMNSESGDEVNEEIVKGFAKKIKKKKSLK